MFFNNQNKLSNIFEESEYISSGYISSFVIPMTVSAFSKLAFAIECHKNHRILFGGPIDKIFLNFLSGASDYAIVTPEKCARKTNKIPFNFFSFTLLLFYMHLLPDLRIMGAVCLVLI